MNESGVWPTPVSLKTRLGTVEYAEFGEGAAVVSLHGAMGGYDQSLLLARTIGEDGYRHIGVSRPGYLGTPLSSGKSPEEQADLCAGLLDELGIETAIIMAVSGGGPCGLTFALRHKDRCRGLVLVSTCGGIMDTPIPAAFHIMKLMARIPACASAMRKKVLANIDQAASRSISDPGLRDKTLKDPEAGPLFMELMQSTADRMSQRLAGTENDIRITRSTSYALDEIAVPTLIVHGTADPVAPYHHAENLKSGIPTAELLSIEGGEHAAIFTHRKEVRARVTLFLRENS